MKQVITLPTGDFTCSLSSGCGAFCSAIATAGNTSASTTATAKQPPSSSVNAPIAGTSMLASTEARSPTPAPSPVEGERAVRYDATGYPSSMGMYVLYVDHKKLTASLRSSLAAARAEVERMRARAGSVAEDIQAATLILNRAVVDAEALAYSPTVEKGAGK